MFIGHYGVALGAKRYAPAVSLGILFLAAQLADLIWPNLVLLGIEQVRIDPGATVMTPMDFVHYPWSHSLVALAAWGLLFGLLYAALTRAGRTAALVIAAVVVSHWVLDVISHRADVPVLLGDGLRVGLGLWNHPVAAVAVELAIFGVGLWLYVSRTIRDRSHRQPRALGAGAVPAGGVCRQRTRAAAAIGRGCGMVRAGDVAAGPVGILGRPAPRRARRGLRAP